MSGLVRYLLERKIKDDYGYEKSDEYELIDPDGKVVCTGSEIECWDHIHDNHGFSVSNALKHQGFKMQPIKKKDVQKESARYGDKTYKTLEAFEKAFKLIGIDCEQANATTENFPFICITGPNGKYMVMNLDEFSVYPNKEEFEDGGNSEFNHDWYTTTDDDDINFDDSDTKRGRPVNDDGSTDPGPMVRKESINNSDKWDDFVNYVWDITLDGGVDEEVGSVDELGWYGLVKFGEDDVDKLREFGYSKALFAIISQDSQGFKHMEVYDSDQEMKDDWDEITNEYGAYNADDIDERDADYEDFGNDGDKNFDHYNESLVMNKLCRSIRTEIKKVVN